MLIFLQKGADLSKIKGILVLRDIFPKTIYVYFRTIFHVSSIILVSLRQLVILPPLTHTHTHTHIHTHTCTQNESLPSNCKSDEFISDEC